MAAIICPGDPVTQVSDFSKLTKLASGKSASSINSPINPNSSIYPFQSKRNSSFSNKNFKNYVYDAKLQTLKNMKLNSSRSKEQDIPWKTTVEDEDYETRLMPWSDSEDIPECLSSPTQNRNQRHQHQHQHQHQKIPLPKRKTQTTKTSTFSVKQTIREKITEFSEKIITQENGEHSKTTRNYTSRTQSLLYDEHEHVGLCDFILLILQSLTECGLKPLILLRESFLDLERSLECGDEVTVAGFKIWCLCQKQK